MWHPVAMVTGRLQEEPDQTGQQSQHCGQEEVEAGQRGGGGAGGGGPAAGGHHAEEEEEDALESNYQFHSSHKNNVK